MLSFNDIGVLGIEVGRDLDKIFTNRIWNSTIHFGDTVLLNNNIKVKDYTFTVRVGTTFDLDLVSKIYKYIEARFGLNFEKRHLDTDYSGCFIIEYNHLDDKDLLNMKTICKISR